MPVFKGPPGGMGVALRHGERCLKNFRNKLMVNRASIFFLEESSDALNIFKVVEAL